MENKIEVYKNEELGQIKIAFLNKEMVFNLHDSCWNLGYTTKNNEGKTYLYKSRIEKICSSLEITGVDTTSTELKPINTNTDFENTWINEQAFYDLCLESKAKNARAFRGWVTGEVLPSIRATGSYIANKAYTEACASTTVQDIKIIDVALSTVLKVMTEAQINPMSKLMAVKEFYNKIGLEIPTGVNEKEKFYTAAELAQMCGVYYKNGYIAKDAISAVINQLDLSESEKLYYIDEKGNKAMKCKESVTLKIAEWFVYRGFPKIIRGEQIEHEVMYKSPKIE
jgi:prophage antirepressor-like protein